jgi:dUTP pyrophosphatase
MMCKLINDSREGKTLVIEQGKGIVQGIFLPFGITEDDAADTQRTGGFGSTTR